MRTSLSVRRDRAWWRFLFLWIFSGSTWDEDSYLFIDLCLRCWREAFCTARTGNLRLSCSLWQNQPVIWRCCSHSFPMILWQEPLGLKIEDPPPSISAKCIPLSAHVYDRCNLAIALNDACLPQLYASNHLTSMKTLTCFCWWCTIAAETIT